jgi:alkylhydroperoxidase family enzyme
MMRLPKVAHGHTLPQKLKLGMIRVLSGFRAPDVVRTLMYRRAFFGEPHGALTHAVMRGPSEWTVGERELMATLVSRVNQCPF